MDIALPLRSSQVDSGEIASMRRYSAMFLCIAALWSAAGCGNPDAPVVSGSTEEATVKGKVSIRGKPVSNGLVSFRSSNINRPNAPIREAKIGKDGSFSIQAFIGENFVEVTCKELANPKNMPLMENEQPVKIRSGEQTLEIDLPSKGPLEPK